MTKESRPAVRTSDTRDAEELMRMLEATLSEEELRQVLGGALLALDGDGLSRLSARLPAEIVGTLEAVLRSHREIGGAKEPPPGPGKVAEEWWRALESWDHCVAESEGEHGRYVEQDESWEPPYLSVGQLASDLDEVAKRLRPLIAPAVGSGLVDQPSFGELLDESLGRIGCDLPEWMDGGDAGDLFGPEVTACLVEWELCTTAAGWHGAEGQDAFRAVERVRRREAAWQEAALDGEALLAVILALEEDAQREVLAGIDAHCDEPPWSEALASVHDHWFRLYEALLTRHAPHRHIDLCRRRIGEDWRLALPVLEHLLAEGRPAEASAVAREASQNLYTPANDWGAVLAAVTLATAAGSRETGELLYGQWRSLLIRSLGHSEQSWVGLLVDAAREGAEPSSFQAALRRWIASLTESPRWQRELATLTMDLGSARLDAVSPTLKRVLSADDPYDEKESRASRRAWLARLGAEACLAEVVGAWHANLRDLIPDPGAVSSAFYEHCADWLQIARDLDPPLHEVILEDWRLRHRRRRNLWRSLAKRDITL